MITTKQPRLIRIIICFYLSHPLYKYQSYKKKERVLKRGNQKETSSVGLLGKKSAYLNIYVHQKSFNVKYCSLTNVA